jgi:hypothetical protein
LCFCLCSELEQLWIDEPSVADFVSEKSLFSFTLLYLICNHPKKRLYCFSLGA